MAAGLDLYAGTVVPAGYWSDTVTYLPAAGGQSAVVTIGSLNTNAVTLDGRVGQAGDPVTMTMTLDDTQPFQLQLAAVCDIAGGTVLTDGWGNYYLFSSMPLQLGTGYMAVSGFGQFSASPHPACFAAGTLIQTHRGAVRVETLRLGDRVRTLVRGASAPVTWTGFHHVDCARRPDPSQSWPVRVAADAFGPGCPRRDTLLSPDHAVHVDGVLVPIRYLVNDSSIAVEPVDRVTYWHVELPAHDVLLADGLPAESYLDTGNRASFTCHVGQATPAVSGGEAFAREVWASSACAPLEMDAARQAAIRLRLRARAPALGFAETGDAALHVSGVPSSDWAWDGARLRARVRGGGRLVLSSRSAVPWSQLASSDDTRRLGVAVRSITVDGRSLALDDVALGSGWHRLEDGFRWTGGMAEIVLPASRRGRLVEVETIPMLRYWRHRATDGFVHAHAA